LIKEQKQFVDLEGELRCKSISFNSQLLVKNTIWRYILVSTKTTKFGFLFSG